MIVLTNNMNKPTKKEMRWFVLKLIDIRKDVTRTPDHIVDIDFTKKDIKKMKSVFKISDQLAVKTKVKEMLARIKGDGEFMDRFNHFDSARLSWKDLPADEIKIKG